jgi:hypothetical protein
MSLSATTLAVSSSASVSGSLTAASITNNGTLTQTGTMNCAANSNFNGYATFNAGGIFNGTGPQMSGSYISTGTIPITSLAAGVVQTSAPSTITGTTLTIDNTATLSCAQPIIGSCTKVGIADSNADVNKCFFGFIDQGSTYGLTTTQSAQTLLSDGFISYQPSTKTLFLPNVKITSGSTFDGSGVLLNSPAGSLQVTDYSGVSSEFIYLAGFATTGSAPSGTYQGSFGSAASNLKFDAGGSNLYSGGLILAANGIQVAPTALPPSKSYVGFTFSPTSFSLPTTATSNSVQIAGSGGQLTNSSHYGVWLVTVTITPKSLVASATMNSTLSTTTASSGTVNMGCTFQAGAATSPSTGVSQSFSYVFPFYSTASNLYIVNTNSSTCAASNGYYQIVRIA